MGIFDRFKHRQAQDRARDMSDAAERKANEKTGSRYESRTDEAQQRMEREPGMDRDRPEQP